MRYLTAAILVLTTLAAAQQPPAGTVIDSGTLAVPATALPAFDPNRVSCVMLPKIARKQRNVIGRLLAGPGQGPSRRIVHNHPCAFRDAARHACLRDVVVVATLPTPAPPSFAQVRIFAGVEDDAIHISLCNRARTPTTTEATTLTWQATQR